MNYIAGWNTIKGNVCSKAKAKSFTQFRSTIIYANQIIHIHTVTHTCKNTLYKYIDTRQTEYQMGLLQQSQDPARKK